MLLVFAMAAAAAIFLYMQLPRVAFEAQRDREELLLQRGREYRRAVELYVRKNNRYPDKIEDLERQQDARFLRRRYKDPLTGKDDWRIIRINAAGELENSLVQKKRPVGGQLTASAPADDANIAENSALARQRSGEDLLANADFPGGGAAAGAPVAGQTPGMPGESPATPANPLDEGLVPLLDAGGNLVQQGEQNADAAGQQQPQAGASPGADAAPSGSQPRLGPGGIPIIENPAEAIARANAQTSQAQGGGVPPAVGSPARTGDGQSGRSAAEIIGGLLTTPVPGGLEGIQQRRGLAQGANAAQGFGAGIAGVASRFEMKGIKVYEEQESIHKWEFVFDARQQATRSQQNAGGGRNPTVPGLGGAPTFNPGGRTGRGGNTGFPQPGPGAPPAPPGSRR